MRKNSNFYENFPRLRKLIIDLPFDENVSIEEKQKAFCSLVDLLVKKGVYKSDGSIQRWRENSLQYLREIIDLLEESDLQLVLINQESFFDRFIFTPCGKTASLYATLKEKNGVNMDSFCDIPMDTLFSYFTEKTGKSPYEKIPKSVAQVFLLEVESFS